MSERIENEHFEIDASVVFQLGESLITDSVQALMELVKNAYDADASYCKLVVNTGEVEDRMSPFYGSIGEIRLEDDGTGMDLNTIRGGWLTISNSGKRQMKIRKQTTIKGRTPLGDKGLGRLGTQRLGRNLEIVTVTEGTSPQQHVWFSWDEFSGQRLLSGVDIKREEQKRIRKHGTTLIISGLHDLEVWRRTAKDELETQLSQMISPYRAVRDFTVRAEIDGHVLSFLEISDRLRDFAQIRYKLTYSAGTLEVVGKARLAYLRPESGADQNEKARFKRLIDDDQGAEFYHFLSAKKRAADFSLKKSEDDSWFATFGQNIALETLKGKAFLADKVADPGSFQGEIDFFSLSGESSNEQDLYTTAEYRNTIERHSGIKVYRDGFGIRVSSDWLDLGKQWTKARSYYTLKPQNTLGYVLISAKENGQLQEKTDREGFTDNAFYRNFHLLLGQFVTFSGDVQQFLRRGYNEYRKSKEKADANVSEEETPESLSMRMSATLGRAGELRYKVQEAGLGLQRTINDADALIALAGKDGSLPSTAKVAALVLQLREEAVIATQGVLEAQKYLEDASSFKDAGQVLISEIGDLREQIRQVYEVISLGLTAEALSHEITNIIAQLSERTKKVSTSLKVAGSKDIRLFTYLEYVDTSIAALRRQMIFLEPSLKYSREKREHVDMAFYAKELTQHYTMHFVGSGIRIEVSGPLRPGTFVVNINKGKLLQVVDNLVLNAEYWIKDASKPGASRGQIKLDFRKPLLYVTDTGLGVDTSVENSIFEPFVTTKPRGRGRGLGLFVVQQLLLGEGCKIDLEPERNAHGRRSKFKIDLTGVLI